MNGSGEFDVRLKFVPEPNAGTPRKRCRILASSALPVRARQQATGAGSTANHEPDSCICRRCFRFSVRIQCATASSHTAECRMGHMELLSQGGNAALLLEQNRFQIE